MDRLRIFYDQFPVVSYDKRALLFERGTHPECAYAVKSGVVRVHTITSTGEERINSFVVRDELLPICWLYNKTQTTLFWYSAHTDCEVYKIPKQLFRQELVKDPLLAKDLLEHFVNDYVSKSMQIRALEQPRASTKIALMIDSLCARYGNRLLRDSVRINIPLTQQDIASLAGLARETVALEISKLKKDHVVTCSNKIYTVNMVRLHELNQDEHDSSTSRYDDN